MTCKNYEGTETSIETQLEKDWRQLLSVEHLEATVAQKIMFLEARLQWHEGKLLDSVNYSTTDHLKILKSSQCQIKYTLLASTNHSPQDLDAFRRLSKTFRRAHDTYENRLNSM